MFERLHTPEELFNYKLGAALKMEREIVEMLDDLIEESREEELKQAFRLHQADTREHVRRVEEVFHHFGWDVDDSPCPTIGAIEKEGKANIKKAEDPLVDAVIAGGAMETEHHEIAVYENLVLNARALGREEAASLLQKNCDEERHALAKVTEIAERIARSPRAAASA
jgi:ferritin-like metal-binding protein YciE